MENKKADYSSNNPPLGNGGGKYNMFYGADPIIFEKAEELRARMTQAEEILWKTGKVQGSGKGHDD